MRTVVTGGAGFIGANLCRHLAEHTDHEVLALDDLSTGALTNLDGVDVKFVEGSILDPGLLDDVLAGVDAVVHLAARPSVPRSIADPMASHEVNATGTMVVLEALRRVTLQERRERPPHLLVASSSSVYGANPTLPKREDLATRPLSPYAASKLATEAYALAYSSSFGMDVLCLRFFNVFGPLQAAGHAYAAVVPAFVDAALAGLPLPVHGDGTQSRDFTFVDTVAQIIADAIDRRVVCDDAVNLAYGTRHTLVDLIACLEGIVEHPLEVRHDPPRPGDVAHSEADSSRLRSLFPDVSPVPLQSGLATTVEWFRTLRTNGSDQT